MSGSTDAAFRRQAVRFGAEAVVSEMVAGETLAMARPDVVRRTCRHEGAGRWIVQLAARRPEDMKRGAELVAEAGHGTRPPRSSRRKHPDSRALSPSQC